MRSSHLSAQPSLRLPAGAGWRAGPAAKHRSHWTRWTADATGPRLGKRRCLRGLASQLERKDAGVLPR